MNSRKQLSNKLQTTCPSCGSIFRLSQGDIEMARGKVRCSECMKTFNALLSLKNYSGEFDNMLPEPKADKIEPDISMQTINNALDIDETPSVSLDQAMYGEDYSASNSFKPLLWIGGILILIIMAIVQVVYYQRYSLISSPHYQQQIISLCKILPCDESKFINLSKVKLLERNIFTHPTRKNALMVSGSFVNQAPFNQPVPNLLISLSDAKGKFITNRLFKADEFLFDKTLRFLKPGMPIQFRLELLDPGTEALAYEFEFYS